MVDLTPKPDNKEESAGDFLDKAIDRFMRNVEENPQIQARLLEYAQNEQNVPPELIAAVLPQANQGSPQEVPSETTEPTQTPQMADTPNETEAVEKVEKPELDAEDIADILDAAMETLPNGENMTLSDVKKFAETSPDIINNLIKTEL